MNGNRQITGGNNNQESKSTKNVELYGFTEADYRMIISSLNGIAVIGMDQIDAFHMATEILRKPMKINATITEEVKKDGEEIHKD